MGATGSPLPQAATRSVERSRLEQPAHFWNPVPLRKRPPRCCFASLRRQASTSSYRLQATSYGQANRLEAWNLKLIVEHARNEVYSTANVRYKLVPDG